MTNKNELLVDQIIAGIQEKKGLDITVVDLRDITDTECQYFIICTGNSPSHVQAVAQSAAEFARDKAGQRPLAVDGMRNAQWVAMDYSDVIVHVFLPEARTFYDIEHLWADASLTELPNID